MPGRLDTDDRYHLLSRAGQLRQPCYPQKTMRILTRVFWVSQIALLTVLVTLLVLRLVRP